jgi:ABC-type Fe3+/spermidine/putrescine transport system ATPase subunit
MLRPESIRLAPETSGAAGLNGVIESVEYLGAAIRYGVATAAGRLTARLGREAAPGFGKGDAVRVSWRPDQVRLFDGSGHAIRL